MPKLRLVVLALLAAAAVTGIVLGILSRGGEASPNQPSSRAGGAASCVAAVEWHRTMYVGTKVLASPVKLGDSAGDGTVPPCDDRRTRTFPTSASSVSPSTRPLRTCVLASALEEAAG